MIFEIKHRSSGATLFSLEADTFRSAVEAALKNCMNLRGADFHEADLRGVGFRGADLWDCDFRNADLREAQFRGAHIDSGDFRGSDLRGAIFLGTRIDASNFRGAQIADGVTVSRSPIQVSGLPHPVIIWDRHMKVGCALRSHEEWRSLDDETIAEMAAPSTKYWGELRSTLRDNATAFWRTHKTALLALCETHAATIKQIEVCR